MLLTTSNESAHFVISGQSGISHDVDVSEIRHKTTHFSAKLSTYKYHGLIELERRYIYRADGITIDRLIFTHVCQNKRLYSSHYCSYSQFPVRLPLLERTSNKIMRNQNSRKNEREKLYKWSSFKIYRSISVCTMSKRLVIV